MAVSCLGTDLPGTMALTPGPVLAIAAGESAAAYKRRLTFGDQFKKRLANRLLHQIQTFFLAKARLVSSPAIHLVCSGHPRVTTVLHAKLKRLHIKGVTWRRS